MSIEIDDTLNMNHSFLCTFVCHHTTHHSSTHIWMSEHTGVFSGLLCQKCWSRRLDAHAPVRILTNCFCGWQLSVYIALMNVTNHSCHHNTRLTWFTFISLLLPQDIAELQRRHLLRHLQEYNVSRVFPPDAPIRYWFRWIYGFMERNIGQVYRF